MKNLKASLIATAMCCRVLLNAQPYHFNPGPYTGPNIKNFGPYSIYVSKQTGEKCTFSGSASGCADEGRFTNILVIAKSTNINTSIVNGSWYGPACPTYVQGNRIPAIEPPPICQTSIGSVAAAVIPTPGTSQAGYAKVKDLGYWTTCSTGQKHYFDSITPTINFNIVSLLLKLSAAEVTLLIGQTTTVTATTHYPGELPVTWSSSNSSYVSVTPSVDGFSATIKALKTGTFTITATLSAGCAKYTQTVKVNSKSGQGCSLSQGYYFSKPNLVWTPSTVNIGGYAYTQAQGKAIWNTSNAGGMKDSKKCFCQVAAIKLSESTVSPTASVWNDVLICESYLANFGKLSPSNLPTGNQNAGAAGGRIGNWIDANHCPEDDGGCN